MSLPWHWQTAVVPSSGVWQLPPGLPECIHSPHVRALDCPSRARVCVCVCVCVHGSVVRESCMQLFHRFGLARSIWTVTVSHGNNCTCVKPGGLQQATAHALRLCQLVRNWQGTTLQARKTIPIHYQVYVHSTVSLLLSHTQHACPSTSYTLLPRPRVLIQVMLCGVAQRNIGCDVTLGHWGPANWVKFAHTCEVLQQR